MKQSPNRTIVELKYKCYHYKPSVQLAPNRTIVELKYKSAPRYNYFF